MTVTAPLTLSLPDDHELRRLEALARYAILDTLPEEAFDRITGLASHLFGTPIALISLADTDRFWFKACVGTDQREANRNTSMCAFTMERGELLVIPDTLMHPRAATLPVVVGSPGVRFYAGVPLTTSDGHALGTLCVADTQPRAGLNDAEVVSLHHLAALVMDELELRLVTRHLDDEVQAKASLIRTLQDSNRVNNALIGVQQLMGLRLSPTQATQHATELLADAAHVDWCSLITVQGDHATVVHTWLRPEMPFEASALPTTLSRGRGALWQAADQERAVYVNDYAAQPGARPQLVALGVAVGAWLPLGHYGGVQYLMAAARLHARPWQERDRALLEAGAACIRQALEGHEHERQREQELLTDPLTGLGNRRALEAAFAEWGPAPACLAVADLNGFKAVNDQLGHARGDVLLRLFADALTVSLPPGARTFRTGGDEFVLLAGPDGEPDLTAALDSAVRATRLAELGLTGASLGVAHWPQDGDTLWAALEVADARMYAHKRGCTEQGSGVTPVSHAGTAPDLTLAGREIHFAGLRVSVEPPFMQLGDTRIPLRPKEAALLSVLAASPERFYPREQLASEAWGRGSEPGNVLEVHISQLRRKLAQLGPSLTVRSRRGVGYALHLGASGSGA